MTNFSNLVEALSWYKNAHGDTNVPSLYEMPGGARLGIAVQKLRKEKKEGKLTMQEISKLEDIGFKWETPAEVLKNVEKGVEMYLSERGI